VRTVEPIGAHGAPYVGWVTSIESDLNAIFRIEITPNKPRGMGVDTFGGNKK
jgi:hypothetical protein